MARLEDASLGPLLSFIDSDMKQLTIVGAGWAGLAAAVAATQVGWHVQLFEAANTAGGRARSLQQSFAGKLRTMANTCSLAPTATHWP